MSLPFIVHKVALSWSDRSHVSESMTCWSESHNDSRGYSRLLHETETTPQSVMHVGTCRHGIKNTSFWAWITTTTMHIALHRTDAAPTTVSFLFLVCSEVYNTKACIDRLSINTLSFSFYYSAFERFSSSSSSLQPSTRIHNSLRTKS